MDGRASPSSLVRQLLRRYRVIVYCLVGLAALDGVIASRRPAWQRYDPDDYAARVENCRRSHRDLIIIGGSPVSEGIDPAALDELSWVGGPLVNPFNLGLPGGTMTDFWHALRHGAAGPPRLVVYGITASDLNDSRLEPHGAHSLIGPGDLAVWARTNPRTAGWAVKHFIRGRLAGCWQLYRHRNAIRLWAADQADACWPGVAPDLAAEARRNLAYAADLARPDGYAPNRAFQARRLDHLKAAGWRDDRFHFLNRYRVGEHVRYLHHLLDWATAQRVAVVLVDMPVSADLEHGQHAPAFALYRAALAEVELARGVRVLRASREAVGLGDEHFADLIHLNAAGAGRLSRWLRGQLDGATPAVAGR
jgi:hypothetical protein